MLSGPSHALFLEGLRNIVGATGKVKVSTNGILSDGAVSKSIVIQSIGRRVQFAAEAIVGVVKVDARRISEEADTRWPYTF